MGTSETGGRGARQQSTDRPSEAVSLEAAFEHAGSFHVQGQLDQAEQLYRAILQVDRSHVGSLHNLAILCFQRGRYDDSVALASEVVRLRPDLAVAHNTVGVALRHLGRLEEAAACCREALRLQPDYAEAHNTLGEVLAALQRSKEAEASYRKALRLQPEYAEAINNLGTILVALGRLEEAETCCREALRLRPTDAAAHNNLAAVLLALGRPQEAEISCRESLRLKPGNTGAFNNIAIALSQQGYFHTHYNDKWIIESVFPGLRRGYFVEAGALGGKWASATYVLETMYEWTGICVEPSDEKFVELQQHRKASKLDNRLLYGSSNSTMEFTYFPDNPGYSGITDHLLAEKRALLTGESALIKSKATITLLDLLKFHKAPSVIHYLCLDTEGSELEILQNFPFDRDYKILAISILGHHCDELLRDHGYIGVDNCYHSKSPCSYFIHKDTETFKGSQQKLSEAAVPFARAAALKPKDAGVLSPVLNQLKFDRLPAAAKHAVRVDQAGVPAFDPGPETAIEAALDWLKRAQDRSRTADGGVASHYSLLAGWGSSYPETTGYIVPTMLEHAARRHDADLIARARRMLDWLVAIQYPEGGFRGGRIDQQPEVPVTFNTGQILLGLAAGTEVLAEDYRIPMRKAADWLSSSQDGDGCWRRYRTPFAFQDDKSYETHVSWGLFEAARVENNPSWAETGLRQVRWALTKQHRNGWMEACCLDDPSNPLTHTLGYALRGILECWRFSRRDEFLLAARRLADGLLTAQRRDGRLPGRLRSDWSAGVPWACLTGTVQVAHCWLILYCETGEERYRDAGFAANKFVRRTVIYDGHDDIRGGIKGSFPVYGNYCPFEYLNWAAKFFIDSNQAEADIREVESAPKSPTLR